MITARISPGGDILVPVPLHPARLAARGYNQARLLAVSLASGWRKLALESQLELADALRRVRATSPQSELHLEAREANVRDAFAAGPQARVVAGRRVVLVDDVVTTGATLRACTQVLSGCGARSIIAICAAATL
jgi:ComF family protein